MLCHFCISSVPLNGSPLKPSNTPSVEFLKLRRIAPLRLPDLGGWPSYSSSYSIQFSIQFWILFKFIRPTWQRSPKDFPYVFHAVPMALQAIGRGVPKSIAPGRAANRQTTGARQTRNAAATTWWCGKNHFFWLMKVALHVSMCISKSIYIFWYCFFASNIECYWDLLTIFGRVMRQNPIPIWHM